MKNPKTTFGILLVILACFGPLPGTQAVVPPPDGGYPGFNTAEGQNALFSLTTGVGNTAVGWYSLFTNATGNFNTALGAGALVLNTGDQNTSTGAAALLLNTSGDANTGNGALALLNNTTGYNNTAMGRNALVSNTTGFSNTAVGASALSGNTTGADNLAVGGSTLVNNTSGNDNIAVGYLTGLGVTTASNVICIGNSVSGENVSDSCYIGSIFGQAASFGTPVLISSNHKLGTTTSSQRFKEAIKPMDEASQALFALKPVSFRYKREIDPVGTPQFGLVAEDVEKVNPDLVVRDKKGKPYSVRYDQVNAMLLNEFIKEHKTVQELKKEIAALKATVKEQDSNIPED